MMKSGIIRIVVSCLVVLLFSGEMIAQDKKLTFGFRERIRNTFMNNNIDFNADNDDKEDFFRFRTNAWANYAFSPKFSVRLQLTNEFRYYAVTPKTGDFTTDELIVDNLFLHYTSGGTNPVSLTLGRQNLIYGEGFILLEGGPWDGSRAIFHDAVKLSIKRGATTIDLLGISNPRDDDRLPVLATTDLEKPTIGLPKSSEGKQWLNDGQENALGAYLVHNTAAKTRIDAYYFLKMEDPEPWIPAGNYLTDQLNLNTLGGRVQHPLSPRLTLTSEWALQMGSQGDISHSGLGGYAYLSYLLRPQKKCMLSAGFNYLSGDDPETEDWEGWNPLFSRWPKWSELYIYSHIGETIRGARRVAYWTNTFSPWIKWSRPITDKLNLTATFYHLEALQSRALANGMSGTGRGNEIQVLANMKFSPRWSGHFLFDYFMPGDFYPEPRDNAFFIRGEIMYTLQ